MLDVHPPHEASRTWKDFLSSIFSVSETDHCWRSATGRNEPLDLSALLHSATPAVVDAHSLG